MLKKDSLEYGMRQVSYINLALIVGAYEGLGYGESVGKMISVEGLDIFLKYPNYRKKP